jgi:hypothetical protein
MAGLDDFMNAYAPLTGSPARPLASCGPNSARIARAAYTPRFGEQTLASLFWWCYVKSDEFTENPVLRRYGGVNGSERQILVGHSGGAAYDLLILKPGVDGIARTRATPVLSAFQPRLPWGISGGPRSITTVALGEAERMGWMLAGAGIQVDARVAVIAVTELATGGDFRLVITVPPEERPTGRAAPPRDSFRVPSSALPVSIGGGARPAATAGVITAGEAGRPLITTARHVIEDAAANARILVGGAPASVVGRSHELTDSCVLTAACSAADAVSTGGVLRHPPVLYLPATYAGAASGQKQTRIIGFDMSIVSPTPFSGGRIYTDPDTIPGDSGAALVDSDEFIVGFAVGRTAFGAPLEFSTWSWARQVFTVHGLA